MKTPQIFADVDACVDALLRKVGPRIVMALPLGLGKPCRFVNALYRRVAGDPQLHLTIVTALSLGRPHAHNDLEKRFMDPLMDRIFDDYPKLAYFAPLQSGALPENVAVVQFFLEPGKSLNNPLAQQNFIDSNYTHVVRDLAGFGVNACAQMVAREEDDGKIRFSLSCNADLTRELMGLMRAQALETLKAKLGTPGGAAKAAARSLEVIAVPDAALPFLERMGLATPGTLKEKMAQKMIVAELIAEGHV